MDWRINELKTVFEEDPNGWQSLDRNWWKTSYTSVSWDYPSQAPLSICWQPAKPPFYHEALFSPHSKESNTFSNHRLCSRSHLVDQTKAVTLSELLCGVKSAEEDIAPYEHATGFFSLEDYCGFPRERKTEPKIPRVVHDEDLARSRLQWQRFEEDLLAPIVEETPTKPPMLFKALSRESSPSSTLEPSLHSISTPPTPQSNNFDNVLVGVKESPPLRDNPSQPPTNRPLNASASSFVPSFTQGSSKSDIEPFLPPFPLNTPSSYLEFPPLPSQILSSVREKECPIPTETPIPDSAFIPPFLQRLSQPQPGSGMPSRRRTTSRTREIIDRLRLSSQARANSDHADHDLRPRARVASGIESRNTTPAPLQDEDGDGWIDLSDHPFARTEDRVRETRNLFLSFTKRRSASASPSPAQTLAAAVFGSQDSLLDNEIEFPSTLSPGPMTPPDLSSSTTSSSSASSSLNDGWLEGPAVTAPPATKFDSPSLARKRTESTRSRHRKRKSSQASASTSSSMHSVSALGAIAGQPFMPGVHTSISTTLLPPLPLSYPYVAPPAAAAVLPPFVHPGGVPYQPVMPVSPPHMIAPVAYGAYMHRLQLAQLQLSGVSDTSTGVPPRMLTMNFMPREIGSVF